MTPMKQKKKEEQLNGVKQTVTVDTTEVKQSNALTARNWEGGLT